MSKYHLVLQAVDLMGANYSGEVVALDVVLPTIFDAHGDLLELDRALPKIWSTIANLKLRNLEDVSCRL